MQLGNRRFYVYGYFLPCNDDASFGEPLYIGKGQGKRAYQHLYCKYVSANHEWHGMLQLLRSNCVYPEVHVLMDWLTEEEAYSWERHLIEYFGRHDLGTGTLYNKNGGGNGKKSSK
jgi:hypothetical protein